MAVQRLYLLADGMMGWLQYSTAEDQRAIRLELVGRDGGDVEGDKFALAEDNDGESGPLVHHVEVGNACAKCPVDGEDDVCFTERGFGSVGVGAVSAGEVVARVDFSDDEELVALWVFDLHALDPGVVEAHNACLRHCGGGGLDVEDAEAGEDAFLDLSKDGKEHRCGEAEVVLNVFVVVGIAFAKVCEPKSLDCTVGRKQDTTAALAG